MILPRLTRPVTSLLFPPVHEEVQCTEGPIPRNNIRRQLSARLKRELGKNRGRSISIDPIATYFPVVRMTCPQALLSMYRSLAQISIGKCLQAFLGPWYKADKMVKFLNSTNIIRRAKCIY